MPYGNRIDDPIFVQVPCAQIWLWLHLKVMWFSINLSSADGRDLPPDQNLHVSCVSKCFISSYFACCALDKSPITVGPQTMPVWFNADMQSFGLGSLRHLKTAGESSPDAHFSGLSQHCFLQHHLGACFLVGNVGSCPSLQWPQQWAEKLSWISDNSHSHPMFSCNIIAVRRWFKVDFPMSVFMKIFSRFNEYQADRYSVAANRQYGRFLGALPETLPVLLRT